jgi:hypothetical protein
MWCEISWIADVSQFVPAPLGREIAGRPIRAHPVMVAQRVLEVGITLFLKVSHFISYQSGISA